MDEYKAAVKVQSILSPNDIFTVEELWTEAIENDECAMYLPRRVRKNVKHFENLLTSYDTLFYVENGSVVLHDPQLSITRERAIEYFEDILSDYTTRPHYKNFNGHVGQADIDIQDFIRDFYPGNSFKEFLQSCPEVFVLFDDDTVTLIENECINYFRKVIEDYGDGEHYMNFRGHIGQAPCHVIDHINSEYPDDDFLEFLLKNKDTFDVDSEGYVFLI